MVKNLKCLFELQNIDFRIIELQNSKEEFPKEAKALEDMISDKFNTIQSVTAKIEQHQGEKKRIEEQLLEAKHNLEKSTIRLNAIKTNKEYDAVHLEIETLKNMILQNEKRVQKVASEMLENESVLNEYQNDFDKFVAEKRPVIDDLRAKISAIDSNISIIISERDKILPEIQKPYLKAYEHIRQSRKNGKVLSIISGSQRNCSICFQNLQPQVINQVRRGTNLNYCQSCGSILVWQDHIVGEVQH